MVQVDVNPSSNGWHAGVTVRRFHVIRQNFHTCAPRTWKEKKRKKEKKGEREREEEGKGERKKKKRGEGSPSPLLSNLHSNIRCIFSGFYDNSFHEQDHSVDNEPKKCFQDWLWQQQHCFSWRLQPGLHPVLHCRTCPHPPFLCHWQILSHTSCTKPYHWKWIQKLLPRWVVATAAVFPPETPTGSPFSAPLQNLLSHPTFSCQFQNLSQISCARSFCWQ